LVHYGADLTLNASETSGAVLSGLNMGTVPLAAMMVYEARDIVSAVITSKVDQEKEGHELVKSCRSQVVHVS
jgi:hypothetical protein